MGGVASCACIRPDGGNLSDHLTQMPNHMIADWIRSPNPGGVRAPERGAQTVPKSLPFQPASPHWTRQWGLPSPLITFTVSLLSPLFSFPALGGPPPYYHPPVHPDALRCSSRRVTHPASHPECTLARVAVYTGPCARTPCVCAEGRSVTHRLTSAEEEAGRVFG